MTNDRTGGGSIGEAVLAALGGAALGAATGALAGLAVPAAVVGGANGAISGARGIYSWRSAKGVAAFVLDSTWSVANTAGALVAHTVGAVRGAPGFVGELSVRHNRHVYRRGFQPRRRFATTIGNVVSGAGDVASERRVRLVTDHEDVHVWQARAFGPAYPVLYVGWSIGGAAAGAIAWLAGRRDAPFGKVVESCSYYLNPFEWWAYSRDGHWPPAGKVDGLGWQRPAARSFASFR